MKIKKFCDTDCPHFIENVEDLGGGQGCAWHECAWTGQVVENMDACPARVGMRITRDSMSTRKAEEEHRQAVITWNPVKEVYDMDSPEEDTRIEGVLPEDGQTVLVSVYYANGERGVSVDVYCEDEGGGFFEDFTWEEVEAWAEMPQPYRGEDDDADSD